jgi:multidrug efflux pump subunit AcrA (membrane-fusion protein)
MRRILLVLVLIGGAAAVAYVALTRPDAGPAAPQNTATVTRGTLEETVEITGAVASSSVHDLTFATAGTVELIDVAVGDRLRRNQLIAKLDTDALEDQLAAAKTSLTAAKTSLTAAESSLTAAKSNLASAKSQRESLDEEQPTAPPGVPAPLPTTELQHDAAIDAADAAVAGAEADVANAEAAIDNAHSAIDNAQASITASETAIDGAEIRSPVAGRLTRLLLEVGDRVTPGVLSPAGFPVQVMDLGDLRIDAQASETDVVDLAVNQDATITFDALDDITLSGHVCEIESVGVLVQGVPSYPVKVCLDTTDSRVRVGLTATVDVATGVVEDALLLPSRAITLINDKHTVTLLLADNRPVETQVTIGAASGGMTEIVNGLTEGQRVLLPDGE